jgi:uncharacterized membrane protein
MNNRKVRGVIIVLPVLALALTVALKNEIISLVLISICMLTTIAVLYRHLDELTNISNDNPKMKTLRLVTVFDAALFLLVIIVVFLISNGTLALSEDAEILFAAAIISAIIFVLGNVSPKIPFNKHTGLRLPWTVADEDTWIVAHRILGYTSFPIAICNIVGVVSTRTPNVRIALCVCAFLFWVSISCVFSYVFYWKKMHGKL